MVSKMTTPLGGTIITVVLMVVLVPPVELLAETDEFRDLFLGKCRGFPKDDMTCKNALNTLEQAFVGKDEDKVTVEDYEKLFEKVLFNHPCGKTMFWSGIDRKTDDFVHRFTKTRGDFFTLEDTFWGHVLDELKWCGKKDIKEIFIKECKQSKPNAVFTFWQKASAKIAQFACKTVTVMLTDRYEQPYFKESVLATVEIPNLRPSEVKTVIVIMVVQKAGNHCDKESLKVLSKFLEDKKINYDCKEMTRDKIEACINDKEIKPCW